MNELESGMFNLGKGIMYDADEDVFIHLNKLHGGDVGGKYKNPLDKAISDTNKELKNEKWLFEKGPEEMAKYIKERDFLDKVINKLDANIQHNGQVYNELYDKAREDIAQYRPYVKASEKLGYKKLGLESVGKAAAEDYNRYLLTHNYVPVRQIYKAILPPPPPPPKRGKTTLESLLSSQKAKLKPPSSKMSKITFNKPLRSKYIIEEEGEEPYYKEQKEIQLNELIDENIELSGHVSQLEKTINELNQQNDELIDKSNTFYQESVEEERKAMREKRRGDNIEANLKVANAQIKNLSAALSAATAPKKQGEGYKRRKIII